MKFRSTALLLSALVLGIPGLAHADINDIRAADRAIEVDFGSSDLKYAESINNTTPDLEKGWVSSAGLSGEWLNKADIPAFNDLYLALDTQYIFGDDSYDGHLQGSGAPFNSNTSNNIFQGDAKVGHFFALNNWAAITPYLDLGFRYWRRSISGRGVANTSVEQYEAGDFMGGFMVQASPVENLVLTASASLGSTFDASMTSSPGKFKLGSSSIYSLQGKVGYAITPTFELVGRVRYDGFGFGASQFVGGGNYEPDSYTHQLSFLGGLAYHLK